MPKNIPYWGSTDNLLDSIRNYFTTNEPDVWQRIITGQGSGYTAKEWDQIVQRLPNVGTTYSQNGKPLMFFEKAKGNWTQPAPSIDFKSMNAGSSNALVPVNSTNNIQYPANYTPPNQQTGTKGIFRRGVKNGVTGTANKVVGKVGGAVAAVSVGTSLGKTFTQALYDLNPQFWEDIGMPEMDASKWKAISTGNDIFDGIFNTLFDLQPDDTIQSYIDENTYAYFTKLLYDAGLFDIPEIDIDIPDFDPSVSGDSIIGTFDFPLEYYATWPRMWEATEYGQSQPNMICNMFHLPTSAPIQYMKLRRHGSSYTGNYGDRIHYFSRAPFTVQVDYYRINRPDVVFHFNATSVAYTINGETVYYTSLDSTVFRDFDIHINWYTDPPSSVMSSSNYELNYRYKDLIKLTYFNNDATEHTTGGIPGTTNTPGATVPSFPSEASTWNVDDFLDWLQQNFPQLWANPITYDLPDPEDHTGETVIEYRYIPVPFPIFPPSQEVQDDDDITGDDHFPITGDSTQTNPEIDPQTQPQTFITYIIDIITGQKDTPQDPDPDGGTGSTPIIPLPTGTTSALFSIYNPTISQLNSFGSWLWTSNIFVQIAQLFNDPMQSIIGLHKVFVTPTTPTTGTIRVGYLDSQVPSKIVSEQYETVDCGEISCLEYFGNVFDYSPHTSVSLYLPFIGIVPLDVADVMRSFITVKYHVDVLNGACLAEVYVLRDSYSPVLYTYSGNCAVEYPISHGSYLSILASILGVAAAGVTTAINPAIGTAALAGSVSGLMSSRATVERSGSFSGNAGAMGIKKPYLIITRPQVAMPKDHNKYQGFPSSSNIRISKCRGFIRVKSVQMEAFIATSEEKLEIEQILKEGILVD